jgi:hypothetical protein
MKRISEDWDGDLLRVIPEAAEIIAPVAGVKLITHGSADEQGRLRHPSTWNDYQGPLAFFDFDAALAVSKPVSFWTNEPIVRCTVLEAFCDAWMHHYVLHLRAEPVWNTFALRNLMMNLLMDARVRASNRASEFQMSDEARREALSKVADSLRAAVGQVDHLTKQVGIVIGQETPIKV